MVMNEIIQNGGTNTYKLPHARKDKIVSMLNHDIPHCLPCQAKIDGGQLSFQLIVDLMEGDQVPTPNSTIANFSHFDMNMIHWSGDGCFDFDEMNAAVSDIEHGDVMEVDCGEDGVDVGELDVNEEGQIVAQSLLDFSSAHFGELL